MESLLEWMMPNPAENEDPQVESEPTAEPETETPPVVHRPRLGARFMEALDKIADQQTQILNAIKGGDDDQPDDEHLPQVSFEPEISQLPVVPEAEEDGGGGGEEETTDSTDAGEGTANVARIERPAFSFPHRKRQREI